MKSYKLGKNKTLSTGENMPYIHPEFLLNNISSSNNSSTNNIIVGSDPTPIASYTDFTKLRDRYKGIDNTSCLSDKLDNKDFSVKKYEKEAEEIKIPLIMDDKEEKTYKELFKQKANEKKKLNTNKALKKLREASSKEKNANKKLRNLKLKYLITQRIEPIIPIKKQVRIFENYYPLDSSFIINDQKNITETAVLGDFSEFKRIKQIIFDKKEQEYKYLLEEKFPGMVDKAYFDKQMLHYSLWLDSQNNQLAHRFKTCLKARYDSVLGINLQLNSDDFKVNSSKFYIRELSKDTQKHIKSMPFVRRLVVHSHNKVFPELTEMSINQEFIDTVNYTQTFRDSEEGFKWVKYYKIKFALKHYIKRMQTKFMFGTIVNTPDFSLQTSCLKNEQGKVVSKRFNIWSQCWIENNNYYSETYASFILN